MAKTPLPQVDGAGSTRRIIESAIEVLREQIPPSWSIALEFQSAHRTTEWRPDAVIKVKAPGSRRVARLIVACKADVTPRVAADVAWRLKSHLGQDPEARGIVVARWGSRRTREVLRELGIGFIDPTGNIDLVLDEPGLVVRVEGAGGNPLRKRPASPSLRGPKAWALMKTLIEVSPPYGVRELASALATDPGYTSRVIKALEEERLVFRERRGPITEVDWPALLSQLTTTYGLLDANKTSTWIARGAIRDLPEKLTASRLQTRWAVTGSFAANLIAPVAAPAMAIVYGDDPAEIAETLELLPAESGANVILARPYDEAAFTRSWELDGVSYVSVAQLAADCLTGIGRMPAEGEALVQWMRANEDRWRAAGFDASPNPLEQ
ncbi:MAG: hypothetical protein GWP04_12195 [Gammaproteobacteria bacterium]|nr:hypothetical protein [Gammaproteobacteria bacterium]